MKRLIILIVLLLVACVDTTKKQQWEVERKVTPRMYSRIGTLPYGYPMYRVRDDSAHVTCWVLAHAAMSCLRDSVSNP